jgi:hypothetical protein
MTDLGGSGQGASCALHPDQQATRTCERCGNFMCVVCTQGGEQVTCPTCRERTGEGQGFPLRRDTWNFNKLWEYSLALFKVHWLILSAAVLIVGGIGIVVNLISQLLPLIGNAVDSQAVTVILTVVAAVVQNVIQGVLGIGLARMVLDVLQGKPPDIGRVFSQFHKAGTYFVTLLIVMVCALVPVGVITAMIVGLMTAFKNSGPAIAIAIALGVLAFIPLIYVALPLVLLQPEMAFRDQLPSPMQLLRNCFSYARGERLNILGVQLIGGLIVFAGVLACCIGAVPAAALSSLLTTGLYLALSNGGNPEG